MQPAVAMKSASSCNLPWPWMVPYGPIWSHFFDHTKSKKQKDVVKCCSFLVFFLQQKIPRSLASCVGSHLGDRYWAAFQSIPTAVQATSRSSASDPSKSRAQSPPAAASSTDFERFSGTSANCRAEASWITAAVTNLAVGGLWVDSRNLGVPVGPPPKHAMLVGICWSDFCSDQMLFVDALLRGVMIGGMSLCNKMHVALGSLKIGVRMEGQSQHKSRAQIPTSLCFMPSSNKYHPNIQTQKSVS